MDLAETLISIRENLTDNHMKNVELLVGEFQKEADPFFALSLYEDIIQMIKDELHACNEQDDFRCRAYILSKLNVIYEKKLLELKIAIDNSKDDFAKGLSDILLRESRKILNNIQENYQVPVTFYCCYTPMESLLIHKFFPADLGVELTFDFGSLLLLTGQIYFFKDDPEAAIDFMKEAISYNPVNSEFLIQAAEMERARGNKITSFTYLDKAMDYVFEEYYFFNILSKKADYLEDDGDSEHAEMLRKVIENASGCYLYIKNPPLDLPKRQEHLLFVSELENAGINFTISDDVIELLKEKFLDKEISIEEHLYYSTLLMALIPLEEYENINNKYVNKQGAKHDTNG